MPSLADLPSYIDIYQEQYHHDIAVLSFNRGSDSRFKDIPTGLPVKITWSQGRLKKDWIGYVTNVEKTMQGSLEQPMMVHCVGASYPLKERATRTFSNMTIPEVAKVIATEFGLKLIADSHPIRFPQLSMAGHSYWQWLVEHAKKIGFSLYVDGATLYLENFDRTIARKSADAALLFYDGKYLPTRSRHVDRTLHYFKPLKGDNVETGTVFRSQKITSGVNPLSSSLESTSVAPNAVGVALKDTPSDVLFREYRSDQVVQSASIAREIAKGAASMARFNLPAKVKCIGDARISPFMPVQLAGTGSKTDGLWVAKKVRHNIRSNGEYDIEALVLTDGTGYTSTSSGRQTRVNQIGVINVNEAIKSGGKLGVHDVPVIQSATARIRPSDVGFNKDKPRWRAGGVNNGK